MKSRKNSAELFALHPALPSVNILCYQTRENALTQDCEQNQNAPGFSTHALGSRTESRSTRCIELSWFHPLPSGTVQQTFLIFHELGNTEALASYSAEYVAKWVGRVFSHDEAEVTCFWKSTPTVT